ncbi:MAG: BREX system P-loop protein BrxC [Ignavibacteriales bacterium]|nr:BREX system P-loop protein BrxC [Ignavibacteriales bacterium]
MQVNWKSSKISSKRISGKEWEDSRGRLLVMGDELDATFAEALGRDPASTTDIATKYENETPLSLDSFINDIREYLATKPTGFRLIFLVDEIGQYISRDPRTMLNLQTLIEDLAVAFNGRVWVMVTAQEEVTDMVKSMGSVQKSDYSKILGRFEIKVKLSSQNARDVIEKRLLRKKPETDKIIRDYFEQQGEVIKTRFTFPGDTSFSDKLLDEDSFARFYPILPYQVELFQNCLISLSNHGAFEGNYASLGARSMLSVFQNALIEIKDGEFGSFVPFDLFFEGTRPLMKAQPFHTIILLESKDEDPFSIRLLKLLYILKYESGFKTTVKNLAVLISKDSESDRRETERLIQNSLDRLARYNYVQEVNGVFEFQTDIQQEILKRIIATELNQGEIRNHIAEIFFDEMLGRNNFLKLKHDRTGLDFPYTKKIDGHDYKKPFGDIKLNLVTGAEEDYPTETELRTLSMAHYELVIALPKNRKLIEDVALLLRTHRFSSQAGTEQMSDEKQAVLASKKEGE